MEKQYLGDGLYVHFDGYQFCLQASNGVSVSDEVYLEPNVMTAFLNYAINAIPDSHKPVYGLTKFIQPKE